MMQTTKETQINGKSYQIESMDADTGSWLLMKLVDSLRKVLSGVDDSTPDQNVTEVSQDQKEQAAFGLIQAMLMNLDRQLFTEVQKEALRVCKQYAAVGDKEVAMPVLMASGKFAIPELKNDISTVMQLTSQALYFNLSPFFLGDGLTAIWGKR